MTPAEKHNQHYTEKFKEHFSEKEAKIYCAIGADITGQLTIGCSDGITTQETISLLKKMINALELLQN